ncbi:MAG: 16S rRNA (cytosine(967)-C(5))-methyltransferase RsmB [Syntrophomonadaceae bacterium]|nr:16S rRNA (cytosine(967)-C(5))-methyltransferase RsmB [Syntrophomonadaceae bacterium]
MQNQNLSHITDAREMAVNLVYNIMENGAYANLSLENALRSSELSSGDKNLVTEIVNGSIRMIKHLDWVLNLFLRKSIAEMNPWARSILRIAAYQILFMERIPDYAGVSSAVAIARKKVNPTMAGVCNAVLRNISRNKDKLSYPPLNSLAHLSVFYSQPEWLVKLWLERYGADQTEKILAYMNQKPLLTLRVNTLRTNREDLCRKLQGEGVVIKPGPSHPDSIRVESMPASINALNSYQAGLFYIQNEAAMLAADIINPQAGEQILDLCSGVGGKATHFAEKMKNQGRVKAVELYPHKISLLHNNCQRLGINIIDAEQYDILTMDEKKLWPKVFLDAPCSGLGVLNRRADARWRKNPQEIEALTQLQSALLTKAGKMTAPGGILVYSTCTVNPVENENIITSFLDHNPEFSLAPFPDLLSSFPLDEEDREMADRGWLTIIPGKYESDGMFYAHLRRSTESNERSE